MINNSYDYILLNPDCPRRGESKLVYGAYLLFHHKSKRVYVGSGKLYFRRHSHFRYLALNQHHNRDLQLAYNDDPNISFHVIQITKTVEEAFDLEQHFLNYYFNKGLLFNIATDARISASGRILSNENKQLLRSLKIGIPRSNDTILKIKKARQRQLNSKEAMERMRIGNLKRSKQIVIDGLVYDSYRDASRKLNIDKTTVGDRINSNKWPTWLSL